MSKKNVILDATVLTTLMQCPRLADFRFNHNFHKIGGKSNSLETGSIVHAFLETYYGSLIKGLSRTQAIGFGFTNAELFIQGCPICTGFSSSDGSKPNCGHKPDEFVGVTNTPKDSEGYKIGWQWALDTCQQYVDYYANDSWTPLEVETVKGSILYEDDEIRVMWKAKLDLTVDTNQGIFPCDHKTMKQRRDTISLNNQFIGQCRMMNTSSVIINKIGFQTTLKPAEKFTRALVSYSAERLMEWQSETLPYYAKLLLMYSESEHFPPNYTSCQGKYGLCDFSKVCEANPSMREEELKHAFVVGPEWNPTNEESEDA